MWFVAMWKVNCPDNVQYLRKFLVASIQLAFMSWILQLHSRYRHHLKPRLPDDVTNFSDSTPYGGTMTQQMTDAIRISLYQLTWQCHYARIRVILGIERYSLYMNVNHMKFLIGQLCYNTTRAVKSTIGIPATLATCSRGGFGRNLTQLLMLTSILNVTGSSDFKTAFEPLETKPLSTFSFFDIFDTARDPPTPSNLTTIFPASHDDSAFTDQHNIEPILRPLIECMEGFDTPSFPWRNSFDATNDIGLFTASMESRKQAAIQAVAERTQQADLHNSVRSTKVVIDSGASFGACANQDEFATLTLLDNGRVMKGIATGLEIKGEGTLEYTFYDDQGQTIDLVVKAYYLPLLPPHLKLIPPQGLRTQKGECCSTVMHGADDSGPGWCSIQIKANEPGWQDRPPLQIKTVQYAQSNNLPVLDVLVKGTVESYAAALTTSLEVTDRHNRNLDNCQKELLKLHYKYGHLGMKHLQWLVRHGRIKAVNAHGVSSASLDLPKCASCEFATMTRRSVKRSTATAPPRSPVSMKEAAIKKGDLQPGQRVSVDHYICKQRGRLYHSRGRTDDSDKYAGGCILVDHCSGLITCKHQVSISNIDTIRAKVDFERGATAQGVIVQQYHADNGIFSSKQFTDELLNMGQTVRFSGVGAPHMNAVAERSIQTVVGMARTMMIHAAMRCPADMISMELWPMAMDHATWLYNHLPRQDSGVSPIELWTRTTQPTTDVLSQCHVWGCPVYVLEPKLQKGGVKIPKWQPRSRRGVYLGFSPSHASSVALILNPESGAITAQFHVIFDDMFNTVHCNTEEPPPEWRELVTSVTARSRVDWETDTSGQSLAPELHDDWLTPDERAFRENDRRRQAIKRPDLTSAPTTSPYDDQLPPIGREKPIQVPLTVPGQPNLRNIRFSGSTKAIDDSPIRNLAKSLLPEEDKWRSSPEEAGSRSHRSPEEDPWANTRSKSTAETTHVTPTSNLRRSTRTRKAPELYNPGSGEAASDWKNSEVALLAASVEDTTTLSDDDRNKIYGFLYAMDEASDSNFEPLVLAASKRRDDPDAPGYVEAMSGPHQEEFWKAMLKEISDLEKRKTWTMVNRADVPKDAIIVPGMWTYKIKRKPDGTFRKFKARWCLRGDIERSICERNGEAIDGYAPVVQWSSVRLMLTMSLLMNLKTRSIDFSNAFAQADMPDDLDIYVEPPERFKANENQLLKLKKSLYGQIRAPKLFYEKLKKGLMDRGFLPCRMDECMFISKDVVVQTYVDDLNIYSTSEKAIDDLLETFASDGDEYNWEMTTSGTVSEFLGIDILREGRTWTLTQRGLIDNVLRATNMTGCKPKMTPCSSDGKPLGKDIGGTPAQEEWNYSSVVGMLLYLASNSRPDLAFSVHQASRFTHNPTVKHEQAVKRICHYLQGTKDKGLILNPCKEFKVECYVDADLAGLYGTEDEQDPTSVKSRTGYIITLANCPIVWASKLQTEICLSTLESEFVALSQSMRALIATRDLLSQLLKTTRWKTRVHYQMKSTVFEDNAGCLKLATTKRLSPRTRHIAMKYFWFTEKAAEYEIVKIDTDSQLADLYTKNLQTETFCKIRKLVCGW